MRIVLIAGETSGDLLGASVVRALRAQYPDCECLGVTGPRMREAGCASIGDIESLSVMGLFEVLRELPRLIRFRRALRDTILALEPDLVLGIDAPDFNLGLEGMLRGAGCTTAHMVSPTVWAWRPRRRFGVARNCHAVLCLYPFEPDCYADTSVRAEYIGHPLADELDDTVPATEARAELGLEPEQPLLAVLPGSRRSEVERLMPPFAEAAAKLAERYPGLRAVVPVASPHLRPLIAAHLSEAQGLEWTLVEGASRSVMRAADLCLLASGTVTLECLLLGRPMVVAYRASAATIWLLRSLRLVRTTHFSLPNILTGEATVPELLQQEVTADHLVTAMQPPWADAEARQRQLDRFAAVRDALRQDAASTTARLIGELAARP